MRPRHHRFDDMSPTRGAHGNTTTTPSPSDNEAALYAALTLLGSLIWCFGFAAAGWAAGGAWETVRHDFRWADYATVAALLALIAATIVRRRHAATSRPPQESAPTAS